MRGFPKQVAFWYGLGEWFNGRKLAFLSDKRFKHWDDITNLASEDNIDYYEWQENEPQMIFQTSGTTGVSKSVLLTAENINKTQSAMCYYDITSDDTVFGSIANICIFWFQRINILAFVMWNENCDNSNMETLRFHQNN